MQKAQSSTSQNIRPFETFLEGWLVRQEHFLDELNSTLQTSHESKDDDKMDLVSRVLAHYQQYYEEKSRMASRNIFLVFSPPWFTPFERTFFWIAGYRPGLAFQLVSNSVTDMSEEQSVRMEQLKTETINEERELTDSMARIQESVAAPPLMELALARAAEREYTGVSRETDTAINILRSEMETVLGRADLVRTRTAESVVDILNPTQNLRFLAAATELQLRIRRWGLQKKEGRPQ